MGDKQIIIEEHKEKGPLFYQLYYNNGSSNSSPLDRFCMLPAKFLTPRKQEQEEIFVLFTAKNDTYRDLLVVRNKDLAEGSLLGHAIEQAEKYARQWHVPSIYIKHSNNSLEQITSN